MRPAIAFDGQPVAWLHRTAAPTIGSIFAPDPMQKLPFELGMGLTNMPLDMPNVRAENPQAQVVHKTGEIAVFAAHLCKRDCRAAGS